MYTFYKHLMLLLPFFKARDLEIMNPNTFFKTFYLKSIDYALLNLNSDKKLYISSSFLRSKHRG